MGRRARVVGHLEFLAEEGKPGFRRKYRLCPRGRCYRERLCGVGLLVKMTAHKKNDGQRDERSVRWQSA